MHGRHRWWQWLVARSARLAARLRALFRRACRPRAAPAHRDERAAFLRGKAQAEERFHAAERELGDLRPLPTGKQPPEDCPQRREHTRPPPRRRR